MLEIYGSKACPFAWRTRIAAFEKGVAFEWLPGDVPNPDPRVAARNPEGTSPLAYHDATRITESLVIAQYIDEGFPGRPMQPGTARERAEMRSLIAELAGLEKGIKGKPDDSETRKKVDAAYATLDGAIEDGREWLGGTTLSLADASVMPVLASVVGNGFKIPPRLERATKYWDRVQGQVSFRETKP